MRKITQFFLISLSLNIFLSFTATAQESTTAASDSIAQTYFYLAFNDLINNTNLYSNQEKIALLEKADSIFRTTENWAFSVSSIHLTCDLLQLEREYEKIDRLSREALSIVQKKLSEDNYYLAEALNRRGISSFEYKKDYKNAIDLFKKLAAVDKARGASLLDVSITYFNLSECFLFAGDTDQAIEYSEKALAIQKDSSNWKDKMIPKLYNQIGLCYIKKKELDLAVENLKEGITVAEKIRPKQRGTDQVILYLYQNLIDVYLKRNQNDLAERYISRALDFQKEQRFIKDYYSHQLQGKLFLNKNLIAIDAFKNSTTAALLEFKDSERHPEIGLTYYQTAQAWLAQNQLDSALHFYQLALIHNSSDFNPSLPAENPQVTELINPLNAIDLFAGKAKTYARLWQKEPKPETLKHAFDNYALAVEAISKTRQSFNAEGSKHTLAEKVIPVFEGAIAMAFDLYKTTGDQQWLEKGLQFAEGNKAAALFEAIQENEALGTTNIPGHLLDQEYDLKVDIAFYERILYETKQQKKAVDGQKIKGLENKLFELKQNYQNLIDDFEIGYPEYYALKFKQETIDLKSIQSHLKNTALMEFFVGLENIFVFTIAKEKIYCEKIPKRDDFESDIKTLRTIITTAPNSKTILASLKEFSIVAHRLYQDLLETSIQKLPLTINSLIIIPDDLLAYLPFSIFLENANSNTNTSYKNLAYLSKRFGISYNYSAGLWLKHLDVKSKPAENDFIGFAPEFSASTDEDILSPLSCNVSEVKRIGELMNTAALNFEKEASLTQFKKNAGNYRIIHLATHTKLDNENSAFNRIYFSDNYLSQNDLYQLQLNASLVVLSACNTGSGELKKGEGVMSLSRGFIHAGCPSILMSLWSVDDCATAEVMLDYYKALNSGMSKEEALKKAKLDYLKETDNILQAHPYYWAAFVQYGNIDVLNLEDSGAYPLMWIGLFLLIGMIFFWYFVKA